MEAVKFYIVSASRPHTSHLILFQDKYNIVFWQSEKKNRNVALGHLNRSQGRNVYEGFSIHSVLPAEQKCLVVLTGPDPKHLKSVVSTRL